MPLSASRLERVRRHITASGSSCQTSKNIPFVLSMFHLSRGRTKEAKEAATLADPIPIRTLSSARPAHGRAQKHRVGLQRDERIGGTPQNGQKYTVRPRGPVPIEPGCAERHESLQSPGVCSVPNSLSSTWDADALLAIPAESRLGEAGLRTIQQSRSRFVRLA